MKKLLIFILFPLVVLGQTTMLNNFNREDFTIDARETPTNVVKINRIFTNVYNTLIVTNLTVVTNLYMTTNSYVIINGATNQQALWQYDGNYLRPAVEELGVQVTNLWSKWILTAYGSFITAPQTEIHLVAGTNNVSTYGKTLILLEGKETNRVVQLQSPMSEGAHLYLMFSTNGGGMTLATQPCYDYPLSQRTIVRNGAWLPTQLAETIHLIGTSAGWVEVSRANPNTNAPGAINPTVGYVPYNQDGILFGDSPWYFRSDSELGFGPGVSNQKRFLLSTNSNLSLGSTALEKEDDVTNRGNTAIGHAAMPKFLLGDDNTALGHVSLYYLTNGGANVAVGKAALYNLTNTSTYFGYNTAVGAWAGQFLSTGESNTFIGSGADAVGGAATNRIAIGQNAYATNDNDVVIGNPNNHSIYVPAQLSLTQGTNTAQVVFGPGTTNVLYRTGADITYTNGATDTKFVVQGPTGSANVEVQGSSAVYGSAGAISGVILRKGADQVELGIGSWFPVSPTTMDNGTMGYSWKDTTTSNLVVNGAYDGVGINYSKTVISQQGTNNPVVFDQITAGTAGYSRGLSLRTNGVALIDVNGSSSGEGQITFGPGTTNVLYRSGSGLTYTNGNTTYNMDWLTGDGSGARLTLNSGSLRATLQGLGGQAIGLSTVGNSDGVVFQGTYFAPFRDATTSLSGPGFSTWFLNQGLTGTNYISAFKDASTTNYVRLEQSMNGPQAVFNLMAQTNNVNGPITGFSLRTNGVEIASFTGSGGGGTYVARAGDIMTGALQAPTLTVTNGAAFSIMQPDAANTMGIRNGTSAQKESVYNTYANSGTDYERGVLDWQTTANSFRVGTEMGGTGTSRSLQFCAGGTNIMYIDGATGKILFNTDNKYDIGASGANRPANIYARYNIVSGNVNFGTELGVGSPASSINLFNTGGYLGFYGSGMTLNGVTCGTLRCLQLQNGYTKVLTSTTATDFLYVSVPNTNGIGGHVVYTVFCTDGTDVQEISGDVKFAAVAKGTTVTATLADVQGPAAVTGGSTLTAAIASNVTTNNVWALGVTATTSLTTTNLLIKWRLETPSTYTVNAIP